MYEWFLQNIGSILVGLLLIVIVIAVIAFLRLEKKRGKNPGCSSCTGCPMQGECHKKTK